MIKAEQIPDAVWIAMQRVIGDHVSVETQTEAIAAAINAWPGMLVEWHSRGPGLILPLPTENTNAEG